MIAALSTSVASWFWGVLLPLSLQGAVLVLLLAVVDHLLPRRTWPQLRVALWLLVLGRLLMPPSFGSPWPLIGTPSALTVHGPEMVPWWAVWLPRVWLLVALSCGAHLLARHWAMHRRWRRWRTNDPSLEALHRDAVSLLERCAQQLKVRVPRLVVSGESIGPLVSGFWRPVVVLPAALLRTLPPERVEAVLLHELAHLRRGDLWVASLASVLSIVHWFNPLIWIATRRLAVVRELACDRTVARVRPEIIDRYRAALLHVAAHAAGMPLPASLRFVVPRRSLRLRLELLAESAGELRGLRRAVVAGVLMIAVLFALPAANSAEARSREIARWIERPPGCMPLKYLVIEALVEEQTP